MSSAIGKKGFRSLREGEKLYYKASDGDIHQEAQVTVARFPKEPSGFVYVHIDTVVSKSPSSRIRERQIIIAGPRELYRENASV